MNEVETLGKVITLLKQVNRPLSG